MGEQVCPTCYRLIPEAATLCPACGADLQALSARAYRDKLLTALDHPLDEVRLRAILALGLRHETDAAQALADCALRHPIDVVEGAAVIAALTRFGQSGKTALARLARGHPARAVRRAAGQALSTATNEVPHA